LGQWDRGSQWTFLNLDEQDQRCWYIGRFIVAFFDLEWRIKVGIRDEINPADEFHNQILSHDFA